MKQQIGATSTQKSSIFCSLNTNNGHIFFLFLFFLRTSLSHILECRILFVSMKIKCKPNFSLELQLLL